MSTKQRFGFETKIAFLTSVLIQGNISNIKSIYLSFTKILSSLHKKKLSLNEIFKMTYLFLHISNYNSLFYLNLVKNWVVKNIFVCACS